MPAEIGGALASMIAILATNVTLFLVFAGIGMLPRLAFGLREAEARDWFVAFWMGLAFTSWFLLLWHFAFAINSAALALVVAAGVFGLWLSEWNVLRLMSAQWRRNPGLPITLILLGLWIANLAMGPLTGSDDSGNYHLQSIRWAGESAIVPGLANLFGPLGFTSASSLYVALLRASPWGEFAHHVATSTLLGVLLAQCVSAAFSFARNPAARSRCLFDLCLLPAVAALINSKITTVATDDPTMLVMLAAFSGFYALLLRDDLRTRRDAYDVVTVTTLVTLAVCFKFSTAIVAGLTWLLIVGLWLRFSRATALRWKPVVWGTTITAGLGLTWMARSVVLSGYPIFPNAVGAFPVPWKVPLEHARAEWEFIVHSGRATAHLLGVVPGIEQFGVWFPRWLPRLVHEDPFTVLVPVVVAVISSVVGLVLSWRHPLQPGVSRGWLVLVPFGPGIIAWLMVAPAPRYLMYLFWILAAACSAQAVRIAGGRTGTLPGRVTLASCLFLSLCPILVNPVLQHPRQDPVTAVIRANLNHSPIGPGTAVPVPEGRTYVTRSGLQLFVPDFPENCLNAPQPCTPNPAPNLRLMKPNDPYGGFVVDGAWDMIGWPYSWLPNLLPALRALRGRDEGDPGPGSSGTR